MTRRDPAVALRQMRDFAAEAVELTSGKTRDALDSDRTLFLALTRLIELVGEASTRVDDQSRARFPEVPWRAIKETRNRLIHAYDASTRMSCGRSSSWTCRSCFKCSMECEQHSWSRSCGARRALDSTRP